MDAELDGELVEASRLDAVIPAAQRIELWHLDVEGGEIPALRSAKALFTAGRIERLMVETLPFRWKHFGVRTARLEPHTS